MPYHLGFPVKVLGAPLRSHDSRRWQNHPHLSVSLAYVRDIFEYLAHNQIRFYRLAGQLAPYLTHPQMPQFHQQISECATELAALGDLARQYQIRLTMHPGHFIQLSSPNRERVARSLLELEEATRLLDAMGLGAEAVIAIHVGGAHGEPARACARFVDHFQRLSAGAQARVALENDDRLFGMAETLWIHHRCGVRLVLDTLHFQCIDGAYAALENGLASAVATWPLEERPKVHFSSPRTTMRHSVRNGKIHWHAPLPNQHSDFIDPFAFIDFLRRARRATAREFDIMLEAKGKDLALLRLREQIARFAPDLAALAQ